MGLQDIFFVSFFDGRCDQRHLLFYRQRVVRFTARVTGTAAFQQIFPTVVFFVDGGGLCARANNKKGKARLKKGIEPRDIYRY